MPEKRTNYVKGRSAEYRVRDALRELGYPVVIRAAGSKGPFDVVAIHPDRVLCIQVKTGHEGLTAQERQKLALLAAVLPRCRVECWHWHDRRWTITMFGQAEVPAVVVGAKGEA